MLKGRVTRLEVHAALDIDCRTAEVLSYCMSYDLSKFCAEIAGSNYSKEEIGAAFRELQVSCTTIVTAKRRALDAMTNALQGEQRDG